MKRFLDDFKKFAMKGNVIDLAIGVIIGGAFGKIVASLVSDIITPLLSLILGKINLSDISYTFKGTDVVLKYGVFLQNIIDFLIIALSIFVVIRMVSRLKKKQEIVAEQIKEEKKSEEILLLTEIRDLLKSKETN